MSTLLGVPIGDVFDAGVVIGVVGAGVIIGAVGASVRATTGSARLQPARAKDASATAAAVAANRWDTGCFMFLSWR
ncbi:MAG: hypothetical protein ABIX46_04185 [Burkholderiaceae bacterium]